MRLLFVKARLEWPRTYGHDVHGFEMMRALSALGHDIALATDVPPSAKAIEGLSLSARWVLADAPPGGPVAMRYFQERYRSYWGISHDRIAWLDTLSREWKADAVIVIGLEILPYLAGVNGPTRVWYAADEWVWHYVSQLKSAPRNAVTHLKQAAVKGLYERSYSSVMDRVWVVSETERRAMRLVTGCKNVDVVPNGVDTETFKCRDTTSETWSAVFWGRLGFGPNLQAMRWFVRHVWPVLRQRATDATFTILGADPPDEISNWHGRDGISVFANVEDLRPEIARRNVVVLPFVSGGGIKNKLLEAASMGHPLVATSRATHGLKGQPPVLLANTADEFAAAVLSLWTDPNRAATLGAAVRQWVEANHTWKAAAEEAVKPLLHDRLRG